MLYVWGSDIYDFPQKAFYIKHYLTTNRTNFFENHKNDYNVCYFGEHAVSNALDNVLDIVKCFISDSCYKNIIFVLVGNGVEKERLINRVKNENITNVYFLSSVSKKAVPNLVKYFDCSYMTGISSPLYRFGLCLNKMYDSMMAGLPVICVFDAPDTLIRQYHCGYQCCPEDKGKIVSAINELANMSAHDRKQMGMKGKIAVFDHFTYEKLAQTFAELF